MPTYAYTCESCLHQIEAFQSIVEEPLVLCPNCGQRTLKRGIGGGSASFQFKGQGFYQTDYKNPSKQENSSCCPCGKEKSSCS